ncbi:MAG: DNA translocase FtsK [Thermoleophilia bacterium]|nr:DNA translocase FtsK [Thermoleophilia bacterium]
MAATTRQSSRRGGGTAVKAPAKSAKTARPATRGAGGKKAPWHSRSERTRELVALVLFGIAAFLLFAILASDKGGVVGRGVGTGLVYAFGKLAILVPLVLIAIGVTTVLGTKLRRSQRFWGAIVFLVGLFLLMGGAVPPFGDHGADLFMRFDFESRAGALGEAFYAGVHGLMGVVGVGIIGWILELVGFGMVTGVTARWLGRRSHRAAQAVKTTAERSAVMTRLREDVGRADGAVSPRPLDFGRPAGPAPHLGPIDFTAGDAEAASKAKTSSAPHSPFGDAFDEWASSRDTSETAAVIDQTTILRRGNGVLDGAEAFSDIYDTAARAGAAVNSVPVATGPSPGAGVSVGTGGSAEFAAAVVARDHGAGPSPTTADSGEDQDGDDDLDEDGQATLPGLARKPRQTELPVTEPVYILPETDMLHKSTPPTAGHDGGQRDTASVLLGALSQFGVEARVVGMVVGPRVTRYELQLAPGTKVAKVSSLKDDLAYALATTEIRILTPIPGKSAVGVEIPNHQPDFVTLGDIYREFPKSAGPLMVWLGKDISGKAVYADLTKLPHLLIAGTTGSGKSGCVNCLVSSILLRSTPEQVRMIMIDPKKVELSHYDRIPHLLVPVVTNMKDAAGVLHNVVKEMEDRYELMELDHTRNLAEMNKLRARRGERPVPYIVIVIDELADLMMASPQEVEDYVIRLAQKSRAVGIHLVVATQRPSADVITGMIKANIPSRIAFAVSSQTDSRVILDVNGAETLLGQGDMLFKPLGSSHLERVQGAYITEEEIAILVNHWRHQAEPEFREELLQRPTESKKGSDDDLLDPDSDDLLADAAQLVIETGSASVSMLQRRLRVGYTRAGRLIDMLERRGIVGPWEGSKPRQIMVDADDAEHVLAVLRAEEVPPDEDEAD